MPELLAPTPVTALVQADAVDDLPAGMRAVTRPVADGARRAIYGAAPLRTPVFHGLDVDLPLAGPRTTVATVHDLSVIDMPSASSRFRAAGENVLVRRALRSADVLIAVSRFTADRIEAIAGRTAHVVELAPAVWARPPSDADVDRVRAAHDLPEQFILQVGTVEPRKNVALVAAAAQELGVPCVLAGGGSRGPDAPASAIGLGYVDVEDLPALYRAATVTAYASHYEGYGLPPVEAMACGGAVVASAVGALPEVVGDGAHLVASDDVDDWVAAMRPLVHDAAARDELTRAAVATMAPITWERTARATVDVYRREGILS
ncbi:glycosyltransferase family 4 protein [Williamsia deligens]|uniref:Glycosyltransferase family 4 protein n=1 Tax=Williamsia deligens TaxID=321325 RepID=A0ABW3G237_9NOCA|nr:glycosyltransferase family 1 protein [Williamsia deligens]MCP2194742.1 Glycosyltransferase involved in cell wall bisynthesis [Williamsia deligens]